MPKKRERERIQHPQPFLGEDNNLVTTKKRSKEPKRHQEEESLLPPAISAKILKEALLQKKEVEEDAETHNLKSSFCDIAEDSLRREDEEDIDDFAGFSETQSQFDNYEEEIDEAEERLLQAFLSNNVVLPLTLAEPRPVAKLDSEIIDIYKRVGKYLSTYTVGKLPVKFKRIPSLPNWEYVLYLTEPKKWSPNAVYQATRIFASNLGVKKAERFYKIVLLPRIRDDIRKNKRLHFALYQSMKKSLYKPAAFFKGILFPLCEVLHGIENAGRRRGSYAGIWGFTKRMLNIFVQYDFRNGVSVNVGYLQSKGSCHYWKHPTKDYHPPTSFECGLTEARRDAILRHDKLLIEKKYALPYRVLDAAVAHFMRFLEETRIMPVIWHQSLLAFVQRYKNELWKEDKENLRCLVGKQRHNLVTPEILRELNSSRNRGEKDVSTSTTSPVSVINKTIEEDRFNIPEVPMEED